MQHHNLDIPGYVIKETLIMLTDPQSITISGSANSLPRISSGVNSGKFQKDDTTVALDVSHSYGKRTRRLVKLTHTKIAPDPLISAVNIRHSMSIGIVFDTPVTGYTVAEAKAVADGLFAALTASSGALTTKVLGGEN
jgi:hypothetical protein